ncbi:MAG: hypothetical protein ACYDG2_02170 [Ruminiclostridium sp.]
MFTFSAFAEEPQVNNVEAVESLQESQVNNVQVIESSQAPAPAQNALVFRPQLSQAKVLTIPSFTRYINF